MTWRRPFTWLIGLWCCRRDPREFKRCSTSIYRIRASSPVPKCRNYALPSCMSSASIGMRSEDLRSHHTRRSEPGGERLRKALVAAVFHPGHISVGPNQHGGGRSDRAECRKLPCTNEVGVDQLNPI